MDWLFDLIVLGVDWLQYLLIFCPVILKASGSKSSSKSKLYDAQRLMLEEQKKMWDMAAPSILEKAMSGGYNPQEKSKLYSRLADPVNRSYKTSLEDLRGEFARTGLKGGVAAGDIKGLLGSKIGALGAVGGTVEGMSRDEDARRQARLLQLMQWKPPAMLGQESKSVSASVGGN